MPQSLRAFNYWAYRYKAVWRTGLLTGVISPTLFLAVMGAGLGSLVDANGSSTAELGGVSYLDFIAPGLLAATTLMTATTEATWPVMTAIKWVKTYTAQLATPLDVDDVLAGHLLFMTARLVVTSAIFLAVMFLFGAVHHWSALLAVPAATLTGLAFAPAIAAFTATQDRDVGLILWYRFGATPLFLFSGAFFPLSQLPTVLEVMAWVLPLAHGVALCRGLCLGDLPVVAGLASTAYLCVWTVAGVLLARASYRRRLIR